MSVTLGGEGGGTILRDRGWGTGGGEGADGSITGGAAELRLQWDTKGDLSQWV